MAMGDVNRHNALTFVPETFPSLLKKQNKTGNKEKITSYRI